MFQSPRVNKIPWNIPNEEIRSKPEVALWYTITRVLNHWESYTLNKHLLTPIQNKEQNILMNYDVKISDRKFTWTFLNGMQPHRYYKERITSCLTNFELNPNSFNQRWLEPKFYPLDDEKMHVSCQRYQRESAKFIEQITIIEKRKICKKPKYNINTVKE